MRSTIAKRYAKGLFDVAGNNGLIDQISADCLGILKSFEENPDLNIFLQNPKIPKAEKQSILENALKSKVNRYTYDFISLLVDKGRIQHLKDCLEFFIVLSDEAKGIMDVEVTSAILLDEGQLNKLKNRLEESTKKQININNLVNPDILGGLVIKIGNKVMDGSIQNQILKLKESLLKAQVMEVEVRE